MSIEKNVLTANVTEYKIAAGTRYELWAIAVWCGVQLSVTIGNQCAHIGAVAMGCPRPPVDGVEKKASISSISAFAHRDEHMARAAAIKLATALKEHVGVTAGVHIDNAEKEELVLLMQECDQLCDAIIVDVGARHE